MKCSYTTLNGKLVVDLEVANTKELVEELAAIQDVCEEKECAECKGKDFRFVTRLVGDDKYYEIMCKKCNFKLGFGQPKKGKGNLYPRRYNHKTKQPIGKWGWHKFDGVDKNDAHDE